MSLKEIRAQIQLRKQKLTKPQQKQIENYHGDIEKMTYEVAEMVLKKVEWNILKRAQYGESDE